MPLDLLAVITIHTWWTLGGPPASSIEVVLARGAAESDATVAAFDSFHVMHASADERICADGDAAGTGADERANVAERLELSAQLATSFALNVAMRELLPAVHASAGAEDVVASAVNASQRPAPWVRVRDLWGLCGGGGGGRAAVAANAALRRATEDAGRSLHGEASRRQRKSSTMTVLV
jgi:hypothetical protein